MFKIIGYTDLGQKVNQTTGIVDHKFILHFITDSNPRSFGKTTVQIFVNQDLLSDIGFDVLQNWVNNEQDLIVNRDSYNVYGIYVNSSGD